jgi:hypothetical protein
MADKLTLTLQMSLSAGIKTVYDQFLDLKNIVTIIR